MAQIQLRDATIRIQDGYSEAAAVANGGGYPEDTVTMTIDTIATVVPPLASFYVDGDPQLHIVTSATGSPTTSITFSPPLSAAVADDAVITFGGRTLEVKIGEGNLTYNEQRNIEYKLDRGSLDTVRQGDDIPMDVSLDFVWEFITASTGDDPTIEDALKQRGEASDWVSSSSDECEPYAVDIFIEHIPPCGSEDAETIILPDFRQESLNHNLRDATVAVTGKCNATEAIVARPAA